MNHSLEAWFKALNKKYENYDNYDTIREFFAGKSGYQAGVIKTLANDIPGVREWLLEHMPE